MSQVAFASPATRFDATLMNATACPSAETAEVPLSPFAWFPEESTLTRRVSWAFATTGVDARQSARPSVARIVGTEFLPIGVQASVGAMAPNDRPSNAAGDESARQSRRSTDRHVPPPSRGDAHLGRQDADEVERIGGCDLGGVARHLLLLAADLAEERDGVEGGVLLAVEAGDEAAAAELTAQLERAIDEI